MTQKTMTHRLSCGMPLLMLPNNEVAVATVDAWVRTGAADEPQEIAGISHFLEHMMFKGTEKYGLGEIERRIESVGGVCNAGTSYDFTHYYITLPSSSVATGIDMLAEMMRHSVIDKTELEKERLVILEEYRRKQDYPPGVLYERLYAELFETGAYHKPVIGTEETIRAITREQMKEYYAGRYSPQDMALVVTGAFDPEEAIRLADEAFAGFDRPLVTMRPQESVRFGRGKRVHIDKPTGGEIYVVFAFPADGMNQPGNVLPLDMAQSILGQGRAALLYQNVKEKRRLCSSISATYPTHMNESVFAVVATCQPEQLEPLRAAVSEELERFTQTDPEEPAMRRSLRLQASAHRFAMETSGSASSNIGYYYTLTGGAEFLDGYLDRLRALSPEAVRRATAETLQADLSANMVEVSIGPNAGVNGGSNGGDSGRHGGPAS